MQPFHQRVFPFRRYSVDEDGRLVVRTRNTGRDSCVLSISYLARNLADITDISRHQPYERLSRPANTQPNNQRIPQAFQNTPPRKQVDGATLGPLFQQLAPLVKDPSNFESNAAAVCASFGLDPITSTEIVSTFKQQLPADRTRGFRCVWAVFHRISPLTSSSSPSATSGPTISPIVEPHTGTLTTASNTTPASVTTTDATSTPTPFKQQRPFCSGSPGVTAWYTTSSAHDISSPPPEITPEIGELHIHHNRVTDVHHVWLYGVDRQWKCVTEQEKVYHPAVDDRVLSMRANGTPNWITMASFTTIRGRKSRARVGM